MSGSTPRNNLQEQLKKLKAHSKPSTSAPLVCRTDHSNQSERERPLEARSTFATRGSRSWPPSLTSLPFCGSSCIACLTLSLTRYLHHLFFLQDVSSFRLASVKEGPAGLPTTSFATPRQPSVASSSSSSVAGPSRSRAVCSSQAFRFMT